MKSYDPSDLEYGLSPEEMVAECKRFGAVREQFLQEFKGLYQAGQSEELILQEWELRNVDRRIKSALLLKWSQDAKRDLAQAIEQPSPEPGPQLSNPLPNPPRPEQAIDRPPPIEIQSSPQQHPPSRRSILSCFPLPGKVRCYIYPSVGIMMFLMGALFTHERHQLLAKEAQIKEEWAAWNTDLARVKDLSKLFHAKDYLGVQKNSLPEDRKLKKRGEHLKSLAQSEDAKVTRQLQQAEVTFKKGDVAASLKQLKQIPKNTTAYSNAQKNLNEIEQVAKEHLASAQVLDKQDKLSDAIASLEKIPDGSQVFPQARKLRDVIESKIVARQPAPEILREPRRDPEYQPAPQEYQPEPQEYNPPPAYDPEPPYREAVPSYIEPAPYNPPAASSGSGSSGRSGNRNSSGDGGAGG